MKSDQGLVEAVTKAILFADCGSTHGWEEHAALGVAAIEAVRLAVVRGKVLAQDAQVGAAISHVLQAEGMVLVPRVLTQPMLGVWRGVYFAKLEKRKLRLAQKPNLHLPSAEAGAWSAVIRHCELHCAPLPSTTCVSQAGGACDGV